MRGGKLIKMDNRIHQVVFDEAKHEYWYEGKKLKGITGTISDMIGKKFPKTDAVFLAAVAGSEVHKEVEKFFKYKKEPLSSQASYVCKTIKDFLPDAVVYSEVLVSDFVGTASCIDIVLTDKEEKICCLFDIKTTSTFDRKYCTMQLSVYKYLYEKVYERKVNGLYVINTRHRRIYKILPLSDKAVEKILDKNK